ncbi:unnamed protein product [Cuscuta epithymum]|uniref:Uncharacterized protein n=1 Tax=Cuscuta epithymum TaxID=186058 RepID=A0AAV0G2P2_9ASTE|nr:unnamed protein product [Cuscuta epithymum]
MTSLNSYTQCVYVCFLSFCHHSFFTPSTFNCSKLVTPPYYNKRFPSKVLILVAIFRVTMKQATKLTITIVSFLGVKLQHSLSFCPVYCPSTIGYTVIKLPECMPLWIEPQCSVQHHHL